jgi:hypothetical protein
MMRCAAIATSPLTRGKPFENTTDAASGKITTWRQNTRVAISRIAVFPAPGPPVIANNFAACELGSQLHGTLPRRTALIDNLRAPHFNLKTIVRQSNHHANHDIFASIPPRFS